MRDALPNIDPYYNNLRTGLVMAHQGWDTLVHRDPDSFELKPLLATAWRFPQPTVLELDIRQGVKFHDGSDLTAEDVVYTHQHRLQPGCARLDAQQLRLDREGRGDRALRGARHAEAADAGGAGIPGAGDADLSQGLSGEGWRRGLQPRRRSAPAPTASPDSTPARRWSSSASRATGRAARRASRRSASCRVRFVPDAATEMTELLSGRADWIWNINPDQFDSVNKLPMVQAIRQESMRVGYLSIDAAGRSGPDNPLTKLKVRQAIWHAIDRKSIADKLVTGGSRVPAAPCYPSQFGCDAAAAVTYDYDPAKARALLAEAGFPNGFETELVSYVLPQWGSAVQNYLQARSASRRG